MRLSAIVVAAAALAGCSAPAQDGHLDEYRERAAEIHADLLERLPGRGATEIATTARGQFGERQLLTGPESDAAVWVVESVIDFPAASPPAKAAATVGEVLTEEEWLSEPTVDQGGTTPFAKVYRMPEDGGEWIVQIFWSDPDSHPRMAISVQSPVTVRGDFAITR